jgi:hypothetical protein
MAAKCSVCLEETTAGAGVVCPSNPAHAVCGACLPGFLRQVQPAELEASLGDVPCPSRCGGRWHLADLKPFLDVDTLVAFASTLGAGMYEALSRRRRAEEDEELMRAAVAAQPPAARVQRLRALVTERDLAPACPRCFAAFIDFDGCFALTCARCRAGVCALCLADCGADAHAHVRALHGGELFDDGEQTAFRSACRKRSALNVVRRVQWLRDTPELQRALVDALADDLGVTGLTAAQLWVRAGVPAVGAGSWQALHAAAVRGKVAVVAAMVHGGCSVNATAEYNRTLLQQAAFHGQVRLLEWLLDHGADATLTSTGLFGGTALHHAARMGTAEAVHCLMRAPGFAECANMLDKRGWTPLHLAATGGHREVVDIMLREGADPCTLSADGRTADQLWVYHQGHSTVPTGLRDTHDLTDRW